MFNEVRDKIVKPETHEKREDRFSFSESNKRQREAIKKRGESQKKEV
jgi:hypothetical protein